MADRIRAALNAQDMTAFHSLLGEDAEWGEGGPDDERTCHNREEIIATYTSLLAQGVHGTVTETSTGAGGVVCTLEVEWPESGPNRRGTTIYQAFFVADGFVTRIVGYDDRDRAVAAVSN